MTATNSKKVLTETGKYVTISLQEASQMEAGRLSRDIFNADAPAVRRRIEPAQHAAGKRRARPRSENWPGERPVKEAQIYDRFPKNTSILEARR